MSSQTNFQIGTMLLTAATIICLVLGLAVVVPSVERHDATVADRAASAEGAPSVRVDLARFGEFVPATDQAPKTARAAGASETVVAGLHHETSNAFENKVSARVSITETAFTPGNPPTRIVAGRTITADPSSIHEPASLSHSALPSSFDIDALEAIQQRVLEHDPADLPLSTPRLLPQVYSPVTVHPVTVNLDQALLAAEIGRVSMAIQDLMQQKNAEGKSPGRNRRSRIPSTEMEELSQQLLQLQHAIEALQQESAASRQALQQETDMLRAQFEKLTSDLQQTDLANNAANDTDLVISEPEARDSRVTDDNPTAQESAAAELPIGGFHLPSHSATVPASAADAAGHATLPDSMPPPLVTPDSVPKPFEDDLSEDDLLIDAPPAHDFEDSPAIDFRSGDQGAAPPGIPPVPDFVDPPTAIHVPRFQNPQNGDPVIAFPEECRVPTPVPPVSELSMDRPLMAVPRAPVPQVPTMRSASQSAPLPLAQRPQGMSAVVPSLESSRNSASSVDDDLPESQWGLNDEITPLTRQPLVSASNAMSGQAAAAAKMNNAGSRTSTVSLRSIEPSHKTPVTDAPIAANVTADNAASEAPQPAFTQTFQFSTTTVEPDTESAFAQRLETAPGPGLAPATEMQMSESWPATAANPAFVPQQMQVPAEFPQFFSNGNLQVRRIDESQLSTMQKSMRYLKNRSWLPDVDMPHWALDLPDSRPVQAMKSVAASKPVHRVKSMFRMPGHPSTVP